jgi:hypothetical protein
MTKISVITPTVREEGLYLVEKALKRQSFRDFEWIIEKPIGKTPKNCVWTLNRDYNRAIKKAQGELIVSWQDYTFAKPDALEKYWYYYEKEPKTIISGVGNKYQDDHWTVKTWQDPRERDDQGTYYECFFNDIEGNFCSISKTAFYDIGGFDESLDRYYGMDFFSVLDRLNMVGGWNFKLDQSNKSFSLEHGRLNSQWDALNWLGDRYNKKRLEYIDNPVLPYLHL